jgi:hypothetical protein
MGIYRKFKTFFSATDRHIKDELNKLLSRGGNILSANFKLIDTHGDEQEFSCKDNFGHKMTITLNDGGWVQSVSGKLSEEFVETIMEAMQPPDNKKSARKAKAAAEKLFGTPVSMRHSGRNAYA